MPAISPHRTAPLILRACMPSVSSFITCTLVGGIYVLGITLSAATQQETAVSDLVQLTVAPFTPFIDAQRFNEVLYILLWACLGALTYEALTALLRTAKTWHDISRSASFSSTPHHLHHSLLWSFVERLLWRWAIWIIAIGGFVLIIPLFKHASSTALPIILEGISWQAAAQVLWLMILGGCVVHGALVLLRLYLFRTRLYGEILY